MRRGGDTPPVPAPPTHMVGITSRQLWASKIHKDMGSARGRYIERLNVDNTTVLYLLGFVLFIYLFFLFCTLLGM